MVKFCVSLYRRRDLAILHCALWCLLTGVSFVRADTLRLNLDDCLSLAMKQGPRAQQAFFDSLSAAGEWRSVAAGSYPQLEFSGELPSRQDKVDYPVVYDPVTGRGRYTRNASGSETWSGRVELSQGLPWGTTVGISTRLYQSRWNNDQIGGGRDTLSNQLVRRFQVEQPIMNGNPVGRERRLGKLAWENAQLSYEMNIREVRYQVTQAFFALVSSAGGMEIARQDMEQGRIAEDLARRKLVAGFIPEVELLQIQVDLGRREGNYRRAGATLEAAQDQLRLELELPLDQPLEAIWQPPDSLEAAPELAGGAEATLASRRAASQLARSELESRANRRLARIQASLQLYYEVDVRRQLLKDLDEAGDVNQGAMLTLDLPLFGFGATSGKVQRLKAEYARARSDYAFTLNQQAASLRQALRDVELARDRTRIALAALDLSQRSYQITSGRFDSGLVSSRDLLDAQLDLTRTRSEALNARMDYMLALANLQRMAP